MAATHFARCADGSSTLLSTTGLNTEMKMKKKKLSSSSLHSCTHNAYTHERICSLLISNMQKCTSNLHTYNWDLSICLSIYPFIYLPIYVPNAISFTLNLELSSFTPLPRKEKLYTCNSSLALCLTLYGQ